MTYHLDSVAGFALSGASTAALWLAQTTPTNVEPWLQAGGTVGLIIGLSYGCVTLWKANQNQKAEIAELNKEIRGDWKDQTSKLIEVLNKLNPDT
jgi:hypothetical protein